MRQCSGTQKRTTSHLHLGQTAATLLSNDPELSPSLSLCFQPRPELDNFTWLTILPLADLIFPGSCYNQSGLAI